VTLSRPRPRPVGLPWPHSLFHLPSVARS
jgi:hypothetical protein